MYQGLQLSLVWWRGECPDHMELAILQHPHHPGGDELP